MHRAETPEGGRKCLVESSSSFFWAANQTRCVELWSQTTRCWSQTNPRTNTPTGLTGQEDVQTLQMTWTDVHPCSHIIRLSARKQTDQWKKTGTESAVFSHARSFFDQAASSSKSVRSGYRTRKSLEQGVGFPVVQTGHRLTIRLSFLGVLPANPSNGPPFRCPVHR